MPYKFNPFTGQLDYFSTPAGGGTSDALLRGKYVRTTRFVEIGSGTSGTITRPANSTIILNDFGGTTDAILSKVQSSRPSLTNVVDGSGNILAVTLDSSGNWVLSGTPSSYPISIIYRVEQALQNLDDASTDIMGTDAITYGLASTQIADGSVSNAEFKHLAGVTSAIQTQINSKQASLGFTAEDVANKSTNTSLGSSDSLYPSQKAVKAYVDATKATVDAEFVSIAAKKYIGSLTSGTTVSSTTLTDTGLSFPIGANEKWHFIFTCQNGCNNTGGLKYAVISPVGSDMRAKLTGTTSGNTAITSNILTTNTETAVNLNTVSSQGAWADIVGVVNNGATAGVVKLQFRSIVDTQVSSFYKESTVIAVRIA